MGKVRINLILNDDNPAEKQTIDFIRLCGRQKSKVVSTIVSSFLEDMQVDFGSIDRGRLTEFFRVYPLLKKASPGAPLAGAPGVPLAAPARQDEPIEAASEPPKRAAKGVASDESIDRGKAALAAFGI